MVSVKAPLSDGATVVRPCVARQSVGSGVRSRERGIPVDSPAGEGYFRMLRGQPIPGRGSLPGNVDMRKRAPRPARVLWPVSLLMILWIAAGSASLAGVTSLLLDSEPGEFIGEGQFTFYTPDDGTLQLQPFIPSTTHDVHLEFRAPFSVHWSLNFAAPPQEALAVGTYEGAVPVFRQGRGQPGLGVGGGRDGIARGCLNTSGRFEVKQIDFDPGGVLAHFRATFEQVCGGLVLRGEVRFDADVPVVLQAPTHLTAVEGRELSFGVRGLDTQGNPVALEATGLPPGASFSDSGDGTGRFAWTPAVGQAGPFLLALDGESAGGDTDVVHTHLDAIPDFDDFDHPIPFTTLPFVSVVYNPEISPAADDPICPSPSLEPIPVPLPPGPDRGSVWYAYTPAENGGVQVTAQARSRIDGPPVGLVGVSVFTGERGALEPRACGGPAARFTAVAGLTYHIKVDVAPASQLKVSAVALPPPPANDDFDAATVVGTLPFSDAIDTRGAMFEPGEPRHCAQAPQDPGQDPGTGGEGPGYGGQGPIGPPFGSASSRQVTNVWYSYAPPEGMRVTVDTSGSNYAAQITAFSGGRGALVPLGCDPARLSFTALADQTYQVMIAGSLSAHGDLLQVLFTGMPALRIQVAVDAVGALDPRTGTALIRGMARCTRPARIVLDGRLRQERRRVQGGFEAVVACDGATPWRAEVTPDRSRNGPRRFAIGPAEAVFRAVGVPDDNPDDAAVDGDRAPISLKGGPPR